MRKMMNAAAIVGLVLAGTSAIAQTEPATKSAAPAGENGPGGSTWRISAGAAYQPRTDINDDGGSFSLSRVGATVAVRYPVLGTKVFLDHALTYEFDDYHFNGGLFEGEAPWTDTQLASYTLGINYVVDRQWAIFGGPVIGVSAETGANLGDAWTYGGIAGVRYQASKDLAIGLGATITAGLEEDVLVLPLVLVNWKISDTLSLANSRPQPGIRGTAGLELDWTFAPKWVLGVGGAYDLRRFRLKDDGIAPNGVGQNSSFPLYVRLGYEPMPKLSVSLYGGVLLGGQLKLMNDSGDEIATERYDAAPFVGAGVSYTF